MDTITFTSDDFLFAVDGCPCCGAVPTWHNHEYLPNIINYSCGSRTTLFTKEAGKYIIKLQPSPMCKSLTGSDDDVI